MTFKHHGTYDAHNPVLIYSKKISKECIEIDGVIKVGGKRLEVGDIIDSHWVGSTATSYNPNSLWVVSEINEVFTPKGHFIINIENCGFKAKVKPAP